MDNNGKGGTKLSSGYVVLICILVLALIYLFIGIVSPTKAINTGTTNTTKATLSLSPTSIKEPATTATKKPNPTTTKKADITSSSGSKLSDTPFTNKFGTRTTKCAHPGCDNYIASSGDTNCCTIHSRTCAECGKYIDEDATYCMDCLKKAAGKVAESKGKTCVASGCSKTANRVLIVTQPSGESESFYLCSSHYSEYKSNFNSKKGWSAE